MMFGHSTMEMVFNLKTLDYRINRQFAEEKGLGKKGFSAALHFIIHDWYSLQIIRQTQSLGQVRNPPFHPVTTHLVNTPLTTVRLTKLLPDDLVVRITKPS